MANKSLVSDPIVRQPGLECSQSAEVVPDLFRQVPGQCAERQTMIHVVESCPRKKFADQGSILLHEADDNAVKWLEDVVTKAFANNNLFTDATDRSLTMTIMMTNC